MTRDRRRKTLVRLSGAVALAFGASGLQRALARDAPDPRFIEQAFAMLRLAQSWGDQPYGAVLVLDGAIVGEGPSRVVLRGDPDAHAEREAIADAQRRLGRGELTGSILYSTSRPCLLCERAAARARVARMVYGRDMHDGGAPRG